MILRHKDISKVLLGTFIAGATFAAQSTSHDVSLKTATQSHLKHNVSAPKETQTKYANSTEFKKSYFSVLDKIHHPKIPVQIGFFGMTQGTQQDILIQDAIGDEFTVTGGHDFNALVGIGYFIEACQHERFNVDVGLNVFYLPQTSVTGNVIQEQLYTNLAYQYQTYSIPLYVMAKAHIRNDHPKFEKYTVNINAGIGPNFMKTTNFGETSLDGGVTNPDDIFSGKSNTTFSATAGIGVQWNVAALKAPLECGYQFFYLGQGNFNRQTNQVLTTLNTGQTYANALVCSITV